MSDSLDVLRQFFFGWVIAHNRPSKRRPEGFDVQPSDLFGLLRERIPEDRLRLIGSGLERGWLSTADDGRGYFIKETAIGSPPQPTVYHAGGGRVIPWWELYVQLADYVRIRSEVDGRDLTVRMEDRQMDITVWAGEQLLLYVENKVTAETAESLRVKMGRYGEAGFDLADDNRGNDPLRKAMYLFQEGCYPRYFALSAIGYEKLFQVEYLGTDHRFRLVEQAGSITTPLALAKPTGSVPDRSATDLLAVELKRLGQEVDSEGPRQIWLSPGKGQTAFNAYFRLPELAKDAIVVGVYKDGRPWSDIKAMGPQVAARLAARLQGLGVSIDLDRDWAFWKSKGVDFRLTASDAVKVAEAVTYVVYG